MFLLGFVIENLMESNTCDVCLANKTPIHCDRCDCFSCKKCSHFINENIFEFQEFLPEHLRGKAFCPNCYTDHIQEEFAKYEDILERAQNIDVYEKKLSSETRLIPRTEKKIKIEGSAGRKDAILQLAFLAASKGFNTIIDVDLVSRKIRNASHKKLVWDGTAMPANVEKKRGW